MAESAKQVDDEFHAALERLFSEVFELPDGQRDAFLRDVARRFNEAPPISLDCLDRAAPGS